jgi:hypothetical protein
MNAKSKSNRRYAGVTLITEETLAIMSDDQLKRLYIDLRSSITKNRRNRKFSKDREIDYCYVQRELQLRKVARKVARK